MLKTSARPVGARLLANSGVKIKCIEYHCPYGGHWLDIWNAAWSTTLVTAQLTQIAALGANCVKVSGGAVTDGSSAILASATYRSRRQFFIQQCRALNLKLYWNVSDNPVAELFGPTSNLLSTYIPLQVALIASIEQDAADILVGFDLLNEVTNQGLTPSTWANSATATNAQAISDMTYYVNAVRAAGVKTPLTFSCSVNSAGAMVTNQFIDLQAQLCDFHDIHPYYQDGAYSFSNHIPSPADFAAFEKRSKYLGHYIIGEMGVGINGGSSIAFQTNWFNQIGEIARRPQCQGAVMFLLADFESTTCYGMYPNGDTSFSQPRLGMTVPFQTWVGNL